MKTQKEQIQAAARAYIIALTKKSPVSGLQRFCVYLDAGKGLDILWPTKNTDPLLPYQVQTTRSNLPGFHFALKGGGYSKTDEIRQMLKGINPAIVVEIIGHGYAPSTR
jgi:hypothetical protein